MKMDYARDLKGLGALERAEVRAPFMKFEGWTVEFFLENGKLPNCSTLLETALGKTREFKTLDAAARALEQIGFKQFTVIQG